MKNPKINLQEFSAEELAANLVTLGGLFREAIVITTLPAEYEDDHAAYVADVVEVTAATQEALHGR